MCGRAAGGVDLDAKACEKGVWGGEKGIGYYYTSVILIRSRHRTTWGLGYRDFPCLRRVCACRGGTLVVVVRACVSRRHISSSACCGGGKLLLVVRVAVAAQL